MIKMSPQVIMSDVNNGSGVGVIGFMRAEMRSNGFSFCYDVGIWIRWARSQVGRTVNLH